MIRIAFNNRGAEHLPEAAPYRDAGLPGWIRAAHDLGSSAFQFDHHGGGGPDPSYFDQLELDAIRMALEDYGVTLSLHHHDFDFCSLPHFAAIVQTLKDVGYDDWLTLELYPRNVRSIVDHTQSRRRLEERIRDEKAEPSKA